MKSFTNRYNTLNTCKSNKNLHKTVTKTTKASKKRAGGAKKNKIVPCQISILTDEGAPKTFHPVCRGGEHPLTSPSSCVYLQFFKLFIAFKIAFFLLLSSCVFYCVLYCLLTYFRRFLIVLKKYFVTLCIVF